MSLASVEDVAKWYEAFPVADVTIGNHDRMIMRKAFDSQIPKRWIKSYNDVLGKPDWNWVENIVYDDVLYEHGEGSQAAMKARNNMMSCLWAYTHQLTCSGMW